MRGNCLGGVALFIVLLPSATDAAQNRKPSSASQTGYTIHSQEELYSREPYVYELIENVIRFETDGKGQHDLTLRIRIQSESAVHEFGLLAYPYASSFESLDVLYVHVRKADGTVIETPLSDVQEVDTAVSRAAPMYTDEREKHIAVKSVMVGDILEAHLRWTIHDPMAPGHFWFDHSYFRSGICLQESLQIDVPANVAVKLHNSDPQPSIREEGGRRLYTFKSSNLKKPEDSKIPDWEKNFHGAPPPDVQLTSFSSWEEVGKWFGSLEQTKITVTPEIRAKAEELTKGRNSEEERLRAIYDFVSTRFRYIAVDLGLSRFTPHAASDVLVNRYGDCKDKHTLFAALLQAVGIASYPVLISSKYRVEPSFPTMSLFDHVITAIPHGESFLFLDTTPEVAPYGLLIQNIRDRQALVIPTNSAARLVITPVDPPFTCYERFRIDSSIDVHGTLDAKMHLEDRGDGELAFRLAYRSTPQNRWQELTQNIAARLGFGGTVSEVTVAQPEDTGKPFWIDFSYHRTDYPDWKEHRVVLPAPPIFVPSLNEEQKVSKEPLPLGAPADITYDATMKFPQGYLVIVPQKVEQKNDFAEFTATYSIENGALHGVLHLRTLAHEIQGSERSQYSDFTRTLDETSRRYIFVSGTSLSEGGSVSTPATGSLKGLAAGKTDIPVPGPASPGAKPSEAKASPAKSLFDAAKRAAVRRDYATSAQLYEQAVATDPNYKEAWNSLGWTYITLRRYEKAEAALRKALALDPAASFAHNNLAQALAAQKKYKEAIPEFQKEIQIDEKSKLAHANLGRVYVQLEQFVKAIPELETAAAITPEDPAVEFNLGRSYAKTGQPEKAAQALNRSVELEPTPARWNWVAYEMALDKLQLDQAQKYAESAIAATNIQMKEISLDHFSNEEAQLPAAMGAYWDTLGWVKFQQGNVPDAEKYVRSAWRIRSVGEIGDHLGQIYEKEGRKAEAIQMYSMALAAAQPLAETKPRLVALLGGDGDVERLTEEGRAKLTQSHTIKIKNTNDAEGLAEFWILLMPVTKVSAVKFISGDEALRPFTSDLGAVTLPDSFPDTAEIKLLQRGKLTCLHSSEACSFVFESAETIRSAN